MDAVANSLMQVSGQTHIATKDALARSIVGALAYADLFDYPLTEEEIWRYQIETSFSREIIELCLATSSELNGIVVQENGFYSLSSREAVFAIRRSRSLASQAVWDRAWLYSRWLSRLPFVKMVAITGALAVNNISVRPDIDLLVVASEGRVWVCRRLIIGLVRLARLFGDDLCPNYIISETNLNLAQQDLFTAHELAQMVPLYGKQLYNNMIAENAWAKDYLPAAFLVSSNDVPTARRGPARKVVESMLSLPVFNRWERMELARLQRKLRPLVGAATEVICSPQQCKGHTGLHRQRITTDYTRRLRELGL